MTKKLPGNSLSNFSPRCAELLLLPLVHDLLFLEKNLPLSSVTILNSIKSTSIYTVLFRVCKIIPFTCTSHSEQWKLFYLHVTCMLFHITYAS